MSMSKIKPRPSSGNLSIPLSMAKANRVKDGEGGYDTAFFLMGIVWAARYHGSDSTERWREGENRHEQRIKFLCRKLQAFNLPTLDECLEWKVKYDGRWHKLNGIKNHDERSDFVVVELTVNGAVVMGEPRPEELLFDGVWKYDGMGVYQ